MFCLNRTAVGALIASVALGYSCLTPALAKQVRPTKLELAYISNNLAFVRENDKVPGDGDAFEYYVLNKDTSKTRVETAWTDHPNTPGANLRRVFTDKNSGEVLGVLETPVDAPFFVIINGEYIYKGDVPVNVFLPSYVHSKSPNKMHYKLQGLADTSEAIEDAKCSYASYTEGSRGRHLKLDGLIFRSKTLTAKLPPGSDKWGVFTDETLTEKERREDFSGSLGTLNYAINRKISIYRGKGHIAFDTALSLPKVYEYDDKEFMGKWNIGYSTFRDIGGHPGIMNGYSISVESGYPFSFKRAFKMNSQRGTIVQCTYNGIFPKLSEIPITFDKAHDIVSKVWHPENAGLPRGSDSWSIEQVLEYLYGIR